ncbi:MAG TPA: hypothetical protein VLE93_00770 [Candidatus Saccharimonadales bacterium]|nr:hypothetical protein [Candidatus Saccharimonadales bacterium]
MSSFFSIFVTKSLMPKAPITAIAFTVFGLGVWYLFQSPWWLRKAVHINDEIDRLFPGFVPKLYYRDRYWLDLAENDFQQFLIEIGGTPYSSQIADAQDRLEKVQQGLKETPEYETDLLAEFRELEAIAAEQLGLLQADEKIWLNSPHIQKLWQEAGDLRAALAARPEIEGDDAQAAAIMRRPS